MAKNITGIKNKKDVIEELNKEVGKDNPKIMCFYYYSDKGQGFYESVSNEILVTDTLKEEAKQIKIEKKNLREVSDFFKKQSVESINRKDKEIDGIE